jgi:hypothetical protein
MKIIHNKQTLKRTTNDSLVNDLSSCITCGKGPLEGSNIQKRWLIMWGKKEPDNTIQKRLSYVLDQVTLSSMDTIIQKYKFS